MSQHLSSRVVVLVKALPQPSKRYGETVCCAGVAIERQWKRLFPVRFRHLSGDSSFSRWDWVEFKYRLPTHDARHESCHVHEESIHVCGKLTSSREKSALLLPMLVGSAEAAGTGGQSLAIIRPRNTRFTTRPKTPDEIEKEREAYQRAASQTSLFDEQLAELDPSPVEFRFQFEDDSGKHNYENGDWETHAMFWSWRSRYGEAEALRRMGEVFNDEYPARGMVFAIGNQAKRPQTWQLLGVIRVDDAKQGELF